MAVELADLLMDNYGTRRTALSFVERTPKARQDLWDGLGVTPRGIDRENVEMLHRTHMGVDNDYVNILLHGLRTSLSDGWGGSMIATELSDILFGTPQPVVSTVNLGTLKPDMVNIALHGHNPMLSDVIVQAAEDPDLVALAHELGARGHQPGRPVLHRQRAVDAPRRPDRRQPPDAGAGHHDRRTRGDGRRLPVHHAVGHRRREVLPHGRHLDR